LDLGQHQARIFRRPKKKPRPNCFFELKRRGVVFGPDESDSQTSEDQDLFDEIYDLALSVGWFDTSRFVDRVYTWIQRKGTISDRQRDALERIRDLLEEKAY
jgi:hypothetical protein